MRAALAFVLVVIALCPPRRPVRGFATSESVARSAAAVDGMWCAVAVIFSLGVVAGSPLLVAVAPVVGIASHRERARRRRQAADRDLSDAMVDFADRTAEGLRAGVSLTNAVVAAVQPVVDDGRQPRHPRLDQLWNSMAGGRSLAAALDAAFPEPDLGDDERLAATTVAALLGSGGAALDAIERLGDALRERTAFHHELRTQAQQAISSAMVMTALPVVFAVVAGVADRSVARLLQSTWVGAACAALSLVLTVIGWEWQQRLIATTK